MKKRAISLVTTLIVLLGALTLTASAAEVDSGKCGDNVNWILNNTGTLTISGSGDMEDYPGSWYAPWYQYRSVITRVVLEDGVTSIGHYAFYNCINLTSVSIPVGVTEIGYGAFCDCSNLTNIDLPDGLISIGTAAFGWCEELVAIEIPDGTESIGSEGFYGCSSLTSVTIPGSVTFVGYDAFYACDSLTDFTYGGSMLQWQLLTEGVDLGLNDDLLIHFGESEAITGTCGNDVKWSLSNDGTLTISGNGEMDDYPGYLYAPWYDYRSWFTRVVVEEGVTSIGEYAFFDCAALTDISLPDGLASLGYGAFYECTGLTEIVLPATVSDMGMYAFAYCSALAKISLSDALTEISDHAFENCISLTEITIPENVTQIGWRAFLSCEALTKVVLPSGLTNIDTEAFFYCIGLTEITIPTGVTSIASGAFERCDSLTAFNVEKDNTNFSSDSCGVLFNKDKTTLLQYPAGNDHTSYDVPAGVTEIGYRAFTNCIGLEKVTIPAGVDSINVYAFYGCSSLTMVIFPDSITYVGYNAFSGCDNLRDIYYNGTQEQWEALGINEIAGIGDSVTLHYAPPVVTITNDDVTGKPCISWNAIKGAVGYEVWCSSQKSGTYSLICTPAADVLSISDAAAVTGKMRYYKVRAILGDTAGELSTASGIWCALAQPTVTVKPITSSGKPNIKWTSVEGATGYEVWYSSSLNGTYKKLISTTADKLSVTHTGAKAGNFYYYRVVAVYGNNTSCNSVITDPKGLWCNLLQSNVSASGGKITQPALLKTATNCIHDIVSVGRYSNWAGVSSVSQFLDEKGNFCFAVDEGNTVSVYKTEFGTITDKISIRNPYDSFGAAVCDQNGYLYMVWGNNNKTSDTSVSTIFVSKYTADGTLVATVEGNGGEGFPASQSRFYTKIPFDAGNCDVAINGDLLVVNYAREMYSGHQSSTLFVVDTSTMTKITGRHYAYVSHSFDQRVTVYQKTDSFLLESQGDCFPRAFVTSVIDRETELNELETFHFWVEEGTYDAYDMSLLNKTRSRLGNILETSQGAALIASSARSLSEKAVSEPYDVFVQIFDPMKSAADPDTYITSGSRSGIAGKNGTTPVTDYGVYWLTDLAGSGKSADVVQAVSVADDVIAVLYELYRSGSYDSTWYMLLNGDGSVLKEAAKLNNVRLNTDEDPVYAQGAVRWVSNQVDSNQIVICSLYLGLPDSIPNITVKTNASSGKPSISWTAVDNALGYEVYCANSKTGRYSRIFTSAADCLSCTHIGAEVGKTYFYKVRAVFGDVVGAFGPAKGVWCDLARPTVKVTNRASDGKPLIQWTTVEGAAGYEVYRCGTKNGSYVKMYTAPANDFDVVHTGAEVGEDYYYKVRAVYGGNASCNSTLTAAKGVWVDLKAPTIKVVNSTSSGKPVISWTKVDHAVGYKVYCAVGSSTGTYKQICSTTNPNKLSVTHVGAEAGEAYYYKVFAIHKNSKCTSAMSTHKGVYCDLARPILTVTLNSSGKPYINWTTVEGASSYKVYCSADGGAYKLLYSDTTGRLYCTHSGATAGIEYSYKVIAICDATSKGNSAYSAVKSISVE